MLDLKYYHPTEDFLQTEYRGNIKVPLKRKELWAVEMDLLVKFQQVCKKHNLRYFAEAGTLLGTVRDHGFIPWDDDIDVVMPRDDYNKLKKIAADEFTEPYFWQDEYTDPGSLRNNHAQLRNSKTTGILSSELDKHYLFNQGVFLDIFPLDALPPLSEREQFWEKLHDLRSKVAASELNYEKPNPFYVQFDEKVQKYNGKNSELIGMISYSINRRNNIRRSKDYTASITVPFEDISIEIPIGYEEILRRCYGIWKSPLKEGCGHGNVIFDVRIPYTDYLEKVGLL